MIFQPKGIDQRIKWEIIKCLICGKEAMDKPKRKRKTCSLRCQSKLNSERFKNIPLKNLYGEIKKLRKMQ